MDGVGRDGACDRGSLDQDNWLLGLPHHFWGLLTPLASVDAVDRWV